MKFNIVVQRLANDQPQHIFIQHRGIHEGKVEDLFHEVVKEQYDRLERAGTDIEFRNDFITPLGSAVMQRIFRGDCFTTVQVLIERTAK